MDVIETGLKVNSEKLQFWGNPVDNIIYAGYGKPNDGFDESGQDFYRVFDMGVDVQSRGLMRT